MALNDIHPQILWHYFNISIVFKSIPLVYRSKNAAGYIFCSTLRSTTPIKFTFQRVDSTSSNLVNSHHSLLTKSFLASLLVPVVHNIVHTSHTSCFHYTLTLTETLILKITILPSRRSAVPRCELGTREERLNALVQGRRPSSHPEVERVFQSVEILRQPTRTLRLTQMLLVSEEGLAINWTMNPTSRQQS